MESFKEFQGKNLDIAILDACSYFNVPREKLEIEIINDSKSGIFGIVGAKKATIRAKKLSLSGNLDHILTQPKKQNDHDLASTIPTAKNKANKESIFHAPNNSCQSGSVEHYEEKDSVENKLIPINDDHVTTESTIKTMDEDDSISAFSSDDHDNNHHDPLDNIDRVQLEKLTRETISTIINKILQAEIEIEVEVLPGRVQVSFDCGQDSGIIIGRDGQTLVSIQYIASRIVSKALNANIRIILDVGEYRHRQVEKLKEMALSLAERVKITGKSFSTRPLSSYHRRIVHVCLQEAHDIQTRSIGEGPMKRVIIMRKR